MNVVSIDAAQARRVAFTVVLWQGAVTVAVALVSYMVAGRLAALSAFIGGGISTLASLVMASLSFRRSSLANPYSAVRGFYVGEAAKLATVVVLFVVVLRTLKVSPLAMFAAYMATFFVYWVALANALPTLGRSKDKLNSAAVPVRRPGDVRGDVQG
ncbi:MAG: ATP synthase subunit I [Gammaproteobacteria bacterium]